MYEFSMAAGLTKTFETSLPSVMYSMVGHALGTNNSSEGGHIPFDGLMVSLVDEKTANGKKVTIVSVDPCWVKEEGDEVLT